MFRLPGTKVHVRLFDRVETNDEQYDIFDVGVQHANGGIDSVVVGGSFHSAKTWMGKIDKKAEKKATKKAAKKSRKDLKAKQQLDNDRATATAMAEATPPSETTEVDASSVTPEEVGLSA